jgi:hypothetical protein
MKSSSLELCSPNALPKHNGQGLDHSIVHFEVLIHSNADHRSLLKPILQHILFYGVKYSIQLFKTIQGFQSNSNNLIHHKTFVPNTQQANTSLFWPSILMSAIAYTRCVVTETSKHCLYFQKYICKVDAFFTFEDLLGCHMQELLDPLLIINELEFMFFR